MNNRHPKHDLLPYPTCIIRPDLLEEGVKVPVGGYYTDKPDLFYYRWVMRATGQEVFQVWYRNAWREANSIDFNFNENPY